MKKVVRPHLDSRLPPDRRARALVAQMTLPEKVAQMVHTAPAIPRLGVAEYNWWNECLHGVARAGRATVFPQAIGMAASFDAPLMGRVATAISDEARAKYHAAVKIGNRAQYFGLTYWTPNINLFRDPRWGRGQETYGEDPHLTARLAVAFVRGLQGDDPQHLKLVATAKHYAVHSGPESLRHNFNAVIGLRDLRETYLPAFEAAVREGGAWSVMGAYNRTLGEPCCGSRLLLQKILREEWGFPGYVVSDCWAIKDFDDGHDVTATRAESAALAARTGCDLNCGCAFLELLSAVKDGLIGEADIDRCVGRLFEARFRLGEFDPPRSVPYARIPASVVGCDAHRALARRMARESVVLLKNNGILPLRKDAANLAVFGPNGNTIAPLLGNYNGHAPEMATVAEGVLAKVSAGTQLVVAKGCELTGEGPMRWGEFWGTAKEKCEAIVAVVGYTADLEGEEGCTEAGGDRAHYGLPGRQQQLLEDLHKLGKPLVVVAMAGSPVDLSWAQEHADAVLFAWYPGEQGGHAVADVLFGDYNPAGRLPITFPQSYAQLPPFTEYAMRNRTYRFAPAEPIYRFGYGLSYTTFRYGGLKLSRRRIRPGEGVAVSVDVRNTGKRAGDEVVQIYVKDVEASVPVPRHHLEGFARVHLRPGQKKTVRFELAARQLAVFDEDGRSFVEPGEFRISVGGGQPDDPHAAAVHAKLEVVAP